MNLSEVIYKNRDNDIIIALMQNGITINHTTLTRVQLSINDYLYDSLIIPNSFDLTNPDKITISLGSQNITVGKYYNCTLYVYDLDNELGISWGKLTIIVEY